MFTVSRLEENPLLTPHHKHPWEAMATFNWCPIREGKKTHVLYRAMSRPELLSEPHLSTSSIGYAVTDDNIHFEERTALIKPEEEFEKFGCEDPRVTKLGKDYYIFYTALSKYPFTPDGIKVAVAKTRDFKKIDSKHLVTPFNAKAMALFPEKINGKFAALLTVNTDKPPAYIAYAEFDKESDIWSESYWSDWYADIEPHILNVRRFQDDQVELGAPPIKTKKGWLIIYSHIQHYFGDNKIFGVEALLLDHDNPRKIVGRTRGPFMVAEAQYEVSGLIPNIIFPSGAIIEGETLEIYYGAADTSACVAKVSLDNLLESMTTPGSKRHFTRFAGNPIITPRPDKKWEAKGTYNPATIDLGGKIHILYRASGDDDTSTIGYAATKDGYAIDERLDDPIYIPRADFEKKTQPGNSGCEDPRIVKIGNELYIFYTAYDGVLPRVAMSSITVENFLNHKFDWKMPVLITPNNVADKDSAVFPEKINDKYLIVHRINESICADAVSDLTFTSEKVDKCVEILFPRRGMWDGGKVGLSTPPIKTKDGWLMLYHGVSGRKTYRIGAVLLDLLDPTIVIARTAVPIFEPEEDYERVGAVPNVVFPCGTVLRGDDLLIYYGAADLSTGVITTKLSVILRMLKI